MSIIIVDGEEIELCDKLKEEDSELDTIDVSKNEDTDNDDNQDRLDDTMILEELFNDE